LPSDEGSTAKRPFQAWRDSLHDLTASKEAARAWRHARYQFAHRLGQALVGAPPLQGPVLYGVWLRWGLLYVGQTRDAERRLRDLPIGESHHLATTFPPEIWERVVVIAWPQLPQAPVLAAEFTANAVGLALEHSLQLRLSPLANTEQRKPDGNWRERSWAASRSRGARLASQIEDLTQAVQAEWDTAARTKPGDEQHSPTCRVVFPEALLAPPTR
jgi:hypothetical protein